MADKKSPLERLAVKDTEGEAWHRKRDAEVERASNPRARKALEMPKLPEWTASEHVTREVFGRFVQDTNTGLVHDVTRATAECRVDAIQRVTFFHFWDEVLVVHDAERDMPCPYCLAVPDET